MRGKAEVHRVLAKMDLEAKLEEQRKEEDAAGQVAEVAAEDAAMEQLNEKIEQAPTAGFTGCCAT